MSHSPDPNQNIEQQIFSDDYLSELDPVSRAVAEKRLEALISKQVDSKLAEELAAYKTEMLADYKDDVAQQVSEARIDAQIKILAHILVYNATGKKRIGLSRTGVVSKLADLQAERAELKQTPPTPKGDEQGGLARLSDEK